MLDNIMGHEAFKFTTERSINRMIETDWLSSKTTTLKGILLTGPPGCGKSTIMKAIKEEAILPHRKFIVRTIDKSNIVGNSKVSTTAIVNAVFNEIRDDPGHIFVLIMDEADDLFIYRGVNRHHAGELTSALLRNIEGENSPQNFFMLATTNYLKHIDKAIESRFGDVYEIGLPDASVREMLIKQKILDKFEICDINDDKIIRIVTETEGFTGRDFDRVASRLEDVEYGILKSKTGATLTVRSVVAEISKQRGIMIKSDAARAGAKSENR